MGTSDAGECSLHWPSSFVLVLVFLWTLFTACKKPKCVRFKLLSKIKETIVYKHLNLSIWNQNKDFVPTCHFSQARVSNWRDRTSLRQHPRVVGRAEGRYSPLWAHAERPRAHGDTALVAAEAGSADWQHCGAFHRRLANSHGNLDVWVTNQIYNKSLSMVSDWWDEDHKCTFSCPSPMEKIKHLYRLNVITSALELWRMDKNVKCLYNNTVLLEISHVLRSF